MREFLNLHSPTDLQQFWTEKTEDTKNVGIIICQVESTAVASVFVWSIWAAGMTHWSRFHLCLEVWAGERADEEECVGSCSVLVRASPAHVLVLSANRYKEQRGNRQGQKHWGSLQRFVKRKHNQKCAVFAKIEDKKIAADGWISQHSRFSPWPHQQGLKTKTKLFQPLVYNLIYIFTHQQHCSS